MKLTTILSATVATMLSIGADGCDGSDDEGTDAKANSRDDAKARTPRKDPAELLTATKSPQLPGPLSKLELGMSAEQAKKAAPELGDGGKALDEYEGAFFSYAVSKAGDELESAALQIEGVRMATLLTKAWGEPSKGEDQGKAVYFWFNETKRIRATVSEGDGREDEVLFEAYLPAKELLGEGKQTLGFEKPERPLLGATAEELGEAYADVLDEASAREADQSLEVLEKLAGDDLSALGPTATSSTLALPPTELGRQFTLVNATFDDGKIDRFRVGITWRPIPTAKDEILALIEAKWGKPRQEEERGKKLLVFSDDPRVVVEDDAISSKWDIEVELAK